MQAHEDIAAQREALVAARTQKRYNEEYEVSGISTAVTQRRS